jgi:lipoprotein-releasing system ATP-binding protein
MEVLKAHDLFKSFGSLQVLKGVSIEVQKAEIVTIIGSSGAGKSTLLQILGTLDAPDKGQLWINGLEASNMSGGQLAEFRNKHLGFVFQFHNLLPEFTALENVCIPKLIGGQSFKEVKPEAEELLTRIGLKDRLHHKPSQLSGGENQRVAVARALINRPSVVFADEPSGNLDEKNSRELHEWFHEIRSEFGQAFIIVTHNMELARSADTLLELKEGQLSIYQN